MKRFVICAFLYVLLTGLIFSYDKFDYAGFEYYIPIQVENQNSNDLTDFQVKLTLDTKSLIDQGYMNPDCSDIRFVDPDNFYDLPYWIESGCNTDNTTIWVKVDSLPADSNKEIWLVFGDPSAISESNSSKVFILFDNFESGNLLGWNFSGTKGWQTTSSYKYEGNYSAMNQDISDSQTACMYKTVNDSYESTLSFYWKVSSEGNYDFLRFYIDESQKNAISGSVDWQKKEYILTPGTHKIKWCYTKDGSVSRGTDSGYVDYIILLPNINVSYFMNINNIRYFSFLDTENYSYMLPITINNPNNETLNDFQVKFVLDTEKLISLGLMNPDCSDIRVSDQSKGKIPYWIETGTCNSTNTTVWVKVPILKPGESTYYVYFGNPIAKSESNGSVVFEFFDDFDGTKLDVNLWTDFSSNSKIQNSILTIQNAKGDIVSKQNFSTPYVIEYKNYINDKFTGIVYGIDSSGEGTIYWIKTNDLQDYAWYNVKTKLYGGGYREKSVNYSGWKKIKIIVLNNNGDSKIYINGNYEWDKQYNSGYHQNGTIGLHCWGGSCQYDYIFIRKYIDQEPTVEVNLSNIQASSPMFYYVKIKVSNDQPINLTDIQIPIYLNESNFNFDLADYTGLTIRIYDKRVSNPYEDIKSEWNYQGIPYWIEYFKPKEKRALIWIKLNLSANENKTLYIYFSKEEPIRFDVYNSGTTTLTDFQIRLPNGISLDSNRKYMIYLENDPATLLPWWSKDNVTWVKVSTIKPGDNYLIIKEDENGLISNGSQVFEFFDDFDKDGVLDSNKWQSTNDAVPYSSILTISLNYNDILTTRQFSPNTVIGFKTKVRDSQYNTVLFAVDSPTGYGPGFLIRNYRFYKMEYKYVDTNTWSYGYNTLNTQSGWRTFELYWLPSNSYLMFDTNRKYVNDKNTYQNRNGYIGLGSWSSGAEFDYIYVRKYSDVEPYVFVATNANDGKKVFEFFDDFDKPWFNWIRGDSSYGPIQYIVRNGVLTTWSSSSWQTMYSPKMWTTNDKIVVEIKDRRDYNGGWHKTYLTDRYNNGNTFRFGVNGADTIQLYGSWVNQQGTSSFSNQNFKWYIHQIVKNGNHFRINWLDRENRSVLNWYSADTTTYRDDLVIRQWQYSTYPPAEWDWVKVYKYLDNPPTISFDKSVVFMISTNDTILTNTTVRIYYPTGTANVIYEGQTDENGLLYVPIQLNKGYYDIEAVVGNETIKRDGFLIDPKGVKNPIVQRLEESITS